MITAIVAIDKSCDTPWDIPQDKQCFTQKTIGKNVVIGYKIHKTCTLRYAVVDAYSYVAKVLNCLRYLVVSVITYFYCDSVAKNP